LAKTKVRYQFLTQIFETAEVALRRDERSSWQSSAVRHASSATLTGRKRDEEMRLTDMIIEFNTNRPPQCERGLSQFTLCSNGDIVTVW